MSYTIGKVVYNTTENFYLQELFRYIVLNAEKKYQTALFFANTVVQR